MWYVIQTITGREDELVSEIKAVLTKTLYKECFVIKAEWMKRLGGEWRIQIRPLFPGYVFIETERPEEIFLELKSVRKYSRLLGNGMFEFTAVEEAEQGFLEKVCGEGKAGGRRRNSGKEIGAAGFKAPWLVRLSVVKTGLNGKFVGLGGPLKYFERQIERINLHKRYAVVRTELCHRKRTVLFGLMIRPEEICIRTE